MQSLIPEFKGIYCENIGPKIEIFKSDLSTQRNKDFPPFNKIQFAMDVDSYDAKIAITRFSLLKSG